MARRVGQVLVAVVAIVGVAILARPQMPDVPPPFEIERATPSPRPTGGAEPTGDPAGDDAEEGEEGGQASRPQSVVVHRLDPRTLVPLIEPQEIPLLRGEVVHSAVSRDGRLFALIQQAGWPEPGSILQVYTADRAGDPLGEIHVPVIHAWISFSDDSRELVWGGQDPASGRFLIGGLNLSEGGEASSRFPDLPVDREMLVGGLHPLGSGRVGLHTYATPEDPPMPGDGDSQFGPVRLLVADLAAGSFDLDVTLPTAPRLEVPDGGGPRELTAGVAFDAARDRAYVAHADRDALLVVDLGTGEVVAEVGAGAPAREPDPAPEDPHRREARWREARLSPDGARLYVSGTGLMPFDASGDQPDGRAVELPLLVADLDAADLRVLDAVTGRVYGLSGDGAHVALLSGLGMRDDAQVLHLLDAATLEPRWERAVGHLVEVSFTPDGAHALVLRLQDRRAGDGGGYVLDVLDVTDGEPAQTLRFYDGFVQPHLHAGVVVQVGRDR